MRLLLPTLALTIATANAATVTWGGAGSSSAYAWWNDGNNSLPTHWNQASPPDVTGADDAVINGGGIQKNGSLAISGGSAMTLNLGAAFRLNTTSNNFTVTGGSSLVINDGGFIALVNAVTVGGAGSYLEVVSGSFLFDNSANAIGLTGGGQAIARAGGTIESTTFFNSQNSSDPTGGTFVIDGGTLLASGAQANPIRAAQGLDGGGFDFTGLGGTIQIDDYTGGGTLTTYLEGKAGSGFFKIDGTIVSGFGQSNSVGGLWLELTDNTGSGTLTLIPEASAALLGAAGSLLLLRRRR